MSLPLPSELEQFIQHELASRAYDSREQLVIAAVQLLRDTKAGFEKLQSELTRRVQELDRGEAIYLDSDSLGPFLDDIEAEVDCELANEKSRSK